MRYGMSRHDESNAFQEVYGGKAIRVNIWWKLKIFNSCYLMICCLLVFDVAIIVSKLCLSKETKDSMKKGAI